MTSPSPFGPSDDSNITRANWLGRYLDVENDAIKRLSAVLNDAADSIDESFARIFKPANFSEQVRKSQLALVHSAIRSKVKDIFGDSKDVIRNGQQDAAVAAVNASLYEDKSILSQMFGNPTDRSQYADSLRATARRNIDAVMTRVLETEQPFSQRVYHSQAIATGQVNQIVNRALAKGDSAADLAKAVRDSIKPEVPGGVSYAARRLARTEINNAFHAQSIHDMQQFPWVDSVEWNLSKTHAETGCLCEQYARIKTFPKENVPAKPHPNCRCFVVAKNMDYDSFENSLVAGQFDNYLDSIIPQPVSDTGSSYSISAPSRDTVPDVNTVQLKRLEKTAPKNVAQAIADSDVKTSSKEWAVVEDAGNAWGHVSFDIEKESIRQGARIAMRDGYKGFPAKLIDLAQSFFHGGYRNAAQVAVRDKISLEEAVAQGFPKRPNELLEAYGKEFYSRIVHSETPIEPGEVIQRGLSLVQDDIDKLVEGQHISMPLSSFDVYSGAKEFATGDQWLSVSRPKNGKPVVLQLDPGAKVAEIGDGEFITAGQFRVTDVEAPLTANDPVIVHIQHVSLKEADLEDKLAKPGSYSKGQEPPEHPDFEFVEPPDAGTGMSRPPKDLKRNQTAKNKVQDKVPNARVVGFDDVGLDPRAATSFAKHLGNLSNEFPDAAASIDSVGFTDIERSGAYGVTHKSPNKNRRTGGFRSRGMYLDINYAQDINAPSTGFQTRLGKDVDERFHTVSAADDAVGQTVNHEFGHVIMNMLEGTPSEITRDDAFNYLGSKYTDIGEPYGKGAANWARWVEDQLAGYSFETDRSGNAVRDFLGSKTGGSTFKFDEAIPEAFSAVRMGKANDAEKALYELLMDSYNDTLGS